MGKGKGKVVNKWLSFKDVTQQMHASALLVFHWLHLEKLRNVVFDWELHHSEDDRETIFILI